MKNNNDFKKYNFKEEDEIIECNHCTKEFKFVTKFHYEDRPKKKDNKIIIPLEMVAVRCYDISVPGLCERCKKFPRCEDCGLILCGWKRHYSSYPSIKNPRLCGSCENWRDYRINKELSELLTVKKLAF